MPLWSGTYPAGFIKNKRLAIINDGKTVFGQQAVTEFHRLVGFTPDLSLVSGFPVIPLPHGVIQGGSGTLQVSHPQEVLVPIKPNARLMQIGVSQHLYGQAV